MKKNILTMLLCLPFFCLAHEKSSNIDELARFHNFAIKNKNLNKYEKENILSTYPTRSKYHVLKEYRINFDDNLNEYFVTANPKTGRIFYYDVVLNKDAKCDKSTLENISKEGIYKSFITIRNNKNFIEKMNYNNEKIYFICRKSKGTVVEFELNKGYY